jgi:hypothetical protein
MLDVERSSGFSGIDPTEFARMTNQFQLSDRAFSREFARFIDFVGASGLDNARHKVARKLSQLRPSIRTLFGDRYFFHEQWERFVDGPNPFQIDISDPVAIRAASFIAGINRVRGRLTPAATHRFRKMCLDALKPNRDIRQLEHEIRAFIHCGQKGFSVSFADLEDKGRFDLLCELPTGSLEVECKTVSEDTGSQIKSEMTVALAETFYNIAHKRPLVAVPGVFVLTLKRPADQCVNLASSLKATLNSPNPTRFDGDDFTLKFLERSSWDQFIQTEAWDAFRATLREDPEIKHYPHCATKVDSLVLALVLQPHKPNSLSERVVQVLKDAADQCSRSKPSVIWLHFIGFAEREFISLAEFSGDGKGGGLNALVTKAVHPDASTTDRRHVQLVRFSADASEITTRPVLDHNRLIVRAASVGGTCYDVPNPFCRFTSGIEI